MTITTEERRRSVVVAYVDRVGRVRCASCADGVPSCDRVELTSPDTDYHACDVCRADIWHASRETVVETVTIEHVTCKIF